MNDASRPHESDPQPTPATPSPTSAAASPRLPRPWLVVAAVVLLSLAFGTWGLWQRLAPGSDDPRAQLAASERSQRAQAGLMEQLQQQVATLRRSDQISRDANGDLQSTLSERDEEIAGLRADVAFYERLVGSTAQRRGLTVHAIRMQRQSDTAWHFASTLTQSLNRGEVSAGEATLSVEGTRAGRLQTLDWDGLRQQEDAPGVAYSFKYFEQLEGDVFLPDGFAPVRVTVRLAPRSGAVVEESFTWGEATREGGSSEGVGN